MFVQHDLEYDLGHEHDLDHEKEHEHGTWTMDRNMNIFERKSLTQEIGFLQHWG